MTDEEIAAIRAGLDACSPGDWVNDAPGCVGIHYPQGGKATVCTTPWERPEDIANAAHIARCQPKAIRALLERIDQLEARLEEECGSPQTGIITIGPAIKGERA